MPMLIGIAGKARSGKDTLANFLHDDHEFTPMAFAGPLKWSATIAFREDIEDFTTQEGKTSENEYWQMTRRKMLQDFGEAMCQEFGEDFWIKRWFLDYAELSETDHIVVTDVRKDIEAELLRGLGGVIVHISREGAGLQGAEGQHKTEQGVTVEGGDIILHNDGTLEDLRGAAGLLITYMGSRVNG